MKGIILAGGYGTRLYPLTKIVCKQLLSVHDKPMVYYPLSVLMLSGIREVLIITTPKDIANFKGLLGDGSQFGMQIEYAVQHEPKGLADAFIIGEKFIGNDEVCLILGDNLFYGHNLTGFLKKATTLHAGATIFGYYVDKPSSYGVVEFDKDGKVLSLEEKPDNPKSNYAIVGLYFYDNNVVSIAKNIKPSSRGEIEITDINKKYLELNQLKVEIMPRGFAWLDTGTQSAITDAASYVKTIEDRQGLKIACIEEIAYRKGFITREQLVELGNEIKNSDYGKYLIKIGNESI